MQSVVRGTSCRVVLDNSMSFSLSTPDLKLMNKKSRGVPSEKDLDTAQYALTSIRNDLRDRRAEAARREGTNVSTLPYSLVTFVQLF